MFKESMIMTFNLPEHGKIEITFDYHDGSGTVYFHQEDVEVTMTDWKFVNIWGKKFKFNFVPATGTLDIS